ncbi:DUF1360 domain-containing protein [Thermoleophilia bacterium SCSIO 60948]|nr:DUF1360 domain-containing protein [Thermoleophilia bacterium SCSIO 60948]
MARTEPENLAEDTASYSDEYVAHGGHAVLVGAFASVIAAATAANRAAGNGVPDRVAVQDIVMIGIATHKLSRLISKSRVAAFARAPFTRYEGNRGHGELSEEPKGGGVRLAVGELLVCPHCLGQWIAAGFAAGLVAAPNMTRLAAAMWSAEAIADGLHLAYVAAEDRVG